MLEILCRTIAFAGGVPLAPEERIVAASADVAPPTVLPAARMTTSRGLLGLALHRVDKWLAANPERVARDITRGMAAH